MLALCLGSRSAKYIKIPNRILNRRVKRTPLLLGCLEETNGSRELKFNPYNAISSQSEDEIFDIINEQFSHKLGALKIIEAFIAESEVDLDTLDTIKDAGSAYILCHKANTSRDNDKVVKKNIERYEEINKSVELKTKQLETLITKVKLVFKKKPDGYHSITTHENTYNYSIAGRTLMCKNKVNLKNYTKELRVVESNLL